MGKHGKGWLAHFVYHEPKDGSAEYKGYRCDNSADKSVVCISQRLTRDNETYCLNVTCKNLEKRGRQLYITIDPVEAYAISRESARIMDASEVPYVVQQNSKKCEISSGIPGSVVVLVCGPGSGPKRDKYWFCMMDGDYASRMVKRLPLPIISFKPTPLS